MSIMSSLGNLREPLFATFHNQPYRIARTRSNFTAMYYELIGFNEKSAVDVIGTISHVGLDL